MHKILKHCHLWLFQGLPNITPIFSRSWLIKIQQVFVLLILAVSFRNACDINRACKAHLESPMSPSISAFGVKAATESITIISIAPERINESVISSACSPLSGWEIKRFSISNQASQRKLGRKHVQHL